MALTRKDVAATFFAALAVVVAVAAYEGWDVPLIGSSHRFAVAAVGLLGIAACACGSPDRGVRTTALSGLGTVALALVLAGLVSGAPTLILMLAVVIAVLWALTTVRHLVPERAGQRPGASTS